MEPTDARPWRELPRLEVPSPVTTVAARAGTVWVGGTGGIAWRREQQDWAQPGSPPVTAATALAAAGDYLFAAGAQGLVRSPDGGRTWQSSRTEGDPGTVAALVPSPRFGDDGTLLAATLGAGVLRSDNAGAAWRGATFGLQSLEVTALAWDRDDAVLAATADGIYRSPNGGRAWREAEGAQRRAVAALALLPEGRALAGLERGGLLRSADAGRSWSAAGPSASLPARAPVMAMLTAADGSVLLGTADRGLLRSTDGGDSWDAASDAVVLALARDRETLYAAATDGVLTSRDGGTSWQRLPVPPVHDLQRLLSVDGRPTVAGSFAGLRRHGPADGWEPLAGTPHPLTGVACAPDGALLAAGPDGLFRRAPEGTWAQLVAGEDGSVALLTFTPAGLGWAASADGGRLLRSADGGRSWQPLRAPFGVLPLTALQAVADGVVAATYDRRQRVAQFWRSTDGGDTWERGVSAKTGWRVVATWHDPPMVSLGPNLFVQRPSLSWDRVELGPGAGNVRRVTGARGRLFVLTTGGLQRSDDDGRSWPPTDAELPVEEVLDVQVVGEELYALLSAGRVWCRPL